MQRDARRPTLHANGLEHGLQGSTISIRQLRKELASWDHAQLLRCGRIGFDNAKIRHSHQGDRLRRGVEEGPIAGLDFAQLPVILFALLLHQRQTRLELCDCLQTSTDRDEPRLLPRLTVVYSSRTSLPLGSLWLIVKQDGSPPRRASSTLCATRSANVEGTVSFHGKPRQWSSASSASVSAETALRITPSPSTAKVMSGRARSCSVIDFFHSNGCSAEVDACRRRWSIARPNGPGGGRVVGEACEISNFIKQTEIATSELIGDHLAGESQVPVPLFGEERQVVVFIRGNHVQ